MLVMSVYNFIPCLSAPLPAEPDQTLFEEFPQLYNTFSQLFLGQVPLKNIMYSFRHAVLIASQCEYGPKKFIRMVQLAFKKLAEYAIIKLRTGMPHLTTLALTFFEKFCGNYLQSQTLLTISVLHAINHLTCKNYDLALTKAKAISDQQQSNRGAKIIEGIALFNLEKLQQSRSIFTKVFRQVSSQMKSQKMKAGVTECTANSFCICAYFFSEIYRKQGEPLLSSFQLTKCVEAAQKWLKDGEHLITKIKDTHSFQVEVKMPLRRLERKMHSLHIYHKKMPKPILKLPQKHDNLKEEDLNQVQNLTLIREKPPSYWKFREQALRSIEKERSQLKRLMEHDQCVIDQIRVKAQLLRDNYCTNDLKESIKELETAENKLLQEIDAKKWLITKDIASTKVIEKGLKGFIACIKYSYLERVFKFLYSPIGIKSQARLIIFVRKFLRREHRESISQCVFRGLRHQVQLLRSKNTSKFRVAVYQLQTGPEGVNFNFQIRQDVFNLLLIFPFYLVLHFNEHNQMFLLTEHLELLKKTKVYGMVKGFGLRLHRRNLIKKKQISYLRLHHEFKINSKIITSMLIFVTETSSSKSIQRIDSQKCNNPFYNFRFHLAATEDIDKAILKYYNARRQQNSYTQIVKIQGSFRRLIAKKQAKNQRRLTNVSCLQVKGVLFTLVKTGAIVLFIENIHRCNKKQIARLESTHELNLAFVVRLRAELQSSSGWEQMSEIVRKSIKIHEIANRIYERSRLAKFFQDFEAKFRKRLSFAKIIDKCKFRGEMREGRFMFMLTQIANSGSPRQYMLRVFSLDSTSIDARKIVFSRDKMFLELNLRRIEEVINLESRSVLQVENNLRLLKQNRVMRREALIGISFKLRHKCAMKQADVQLIKKWITENNIYCEEQQFSSESDSQ